MFIPETIEEIKIPGGKRAAKAAIKSFGSIDEAWYWNYQGRISRDRFRAAARAL